MLINYYVDPMWWPQWVLVVWPTSFMLIATSAIVNGFFLKVAAISVALNALLYVLVAALLLRSVTWLRSNNRSRVP